MEKNKAERPIIETKVGRTTFEVFAYFPKDKRKTFEEVLLGMAKKEKH